MSETNDLFTETNTDPAVDETKEYLPELVGEGKKYKDNEALAKSKVHGDLMINKLQNELQEIREDFKKRLDTEETLKEIKTLAANFTNPAGNRPDPLDDERAPENNVSPKSVSPEDIEKIVQENIRKNKEADTHANNVAFVKDELTKVWGSNFPKHLEERVKELGLGQDFATGVAASHPKAFLKMVLGDGTQSVASVSPEHTSVRSQPSFSSGRKTYKDYEKLRKENPALYHSPRTQNEMHKNALELGLDFYK